MNLYDKIPTELKNIPHWLTWHYNEKANGKIEKVPNVQQGEWDNRKLYTFTEAIQEYNRLCQSDKDKPHADGIGIAIRTDNPLIGIDIDNVTKDTIPEPVRAILTTAKESGGYIEKSVSGKGFHIIGTCSNKQMLLDMFRAWHNVTGAKSADQHLEMYASGHYFTVSGNVLYGTLGNIDKSIQLAWEYITGKPLITSVSAIYATGTPGNAHTDAVGEGAINHTNPSIKIAPGANPNRHFSGDDWYILSFPAKPIDDVIQKMYESNPDIKNVMEQGYDGFPNEWYNQLSDKTPSGIDMRIVGTLVFWLYRYGPDAIVDIILNSAISRDKKRDYWTHTVKTAFQSAKKFYGGAIDKDKLTPLQEQFYNKYIRQRFKKG